VIFVFLDDGTLDVIADLEEARRDYEGIDVEGGVYRFYDEDGTRLEPRFTVPNKVRSFLGIVSSVESGKFELVRASDAGESDILKCLHDAVLLNPNPWFKDLEEVRLFLTGKRGGREE
jgi:hypothetical protein